MSVLLRNAFTNRSYGAYGSVLVDASRAHHAPITPVLGDRAGKAASGRLRRVTIGLDFGTSSTKCCFREERDGQPYTLVAHDTSREDMNRLLFQTSVALVNDRLLFGHRAETVGTGVIRSFKTCLMCQARAEHPRLSPLPKSGACFHCKESRPGWFTLGDQQISAEDLATLHLAVVLNEVKRRLLTVLDTDASAVRINVNAAAPLDQMSEFGDLEEYFQRSVYYAWQLADQGRNDWSLRDALSALARVRCNPLPPVQQSPTRVFPETHAAMTAYLLHPRSESGLYGLVDIGAGTTDVAFFWLQKGEELTKAWYYAAGSKRVGMDDVDAALMHVLKCPDGNLRAAREALSLDAIYASHRLLEPLLRRMYEHQARVLREAMQVDPRDLAWRRDGKALYKLFLVGGGAAFDPCAKF